MVALVHSGCIGCQWLLWLAMVALVDQWLRWLSLTALVVKVCIGCQWLNWLFITALLSNVALSTMRWRSMFLLVVNGCVSCLWLCWLTVVVVLVSGGAGCQKKIPSTTTKPLLNTVTNYHYQIPLPKSIHHCNGHHEIFCYELVHYRIPDTGYRLLNTYSVPTYSIMYTHNTHSVYLALHTIRIAYVQRALALTIKYTERSYTDSVDLERLVFLESLWILHSFATYDAGKLSTITVVTALYNLYAMHYSVQYSTIQHNHPGSQPGIITKHTYIYTRNKPCNRSLSNT